MALKFLSYRARSEDEVKSHLVRRGYTIAVAETTLKRLRAQSFLDDATFAQEWALSKANRGFGPKRIGQELKAKGIVEPLIQEAIRRAFQPGDEEQKAKQLLGKRFKENNFSDPKVLRRAVAFLQRRGFTSQVALDLLRCRVQED